LSVKAHSKEATGLVNCTGDIIDIADNPAIGADRGLGGASCPRSCKLGLENNEVETASKTSPKLPSSTQKKSHSTTISK